VLASVVIAGLMGVATANQPLTLDEAIQMAKRNNGSVRAAYLDYQAAKASTNVAYASFLPTITPSFSRTEGRTNVLTGPSRGHSTDISNDANITARWLLLDNGTRRTTYRQRLLNGEASSLNALQTLRNTVFEVHQRYYDALRAQELLKVQQAQLERANTILKQTEFRASPEVGDAPRKDVLQARADALNAKASELAAVNRVETSKASLKATVGLSPDDDPVLVEPEQKTPEMVDYSLDQAFSEGLAKRPDLRGDKLRIQAQKENVKAARLDGQLRYELEAVAQKSFSDSQFDRGQLQFNINIPLYDGKRSAEALRAEQLTLQSVSASAEQAEREAKAEIESAFKEFAQNLRRLEASMLARDAARLNYKAAQESQQEGAANLIEVLTAQVTLATAESNYVEAFYDTLISEVRLRLVTGQPLPGESE